MYIVIEFCIMGKMIEMFGNVDNDLVGLEYEYKYHKD